MDLENAQNTKVVRLPKFLSSDEIDQVSELGSGLLQQIEGAELRYDAGMFPSTTQDQKRFLRDNPFFSRKFPLLASQINFAARRAERLESLLTSCGAEVRSYNNSNAWHVAYLQANALLESRLPALAAKIRAAVHHADKEQGWGLLVDPYHVRCAEYHRQRAPSTALPDTRHYDENSLVTVDILLNSGFQGGEFCTLESDRRLASHDFQEAGDAVVFVSHKYHCVMPLTHGQRRVLVVEFWRGPARQCPHRCGILGETCPCEVASMTAPCTQQGVHRWCERSCRLTDCTAEQ